MDDTILHAITSQKSDSQTFNLIAELLETIKRDMKAQAETTRNCQNEWRTRLAKIEYILTGPDGKNGLRFQVKEHERKLDDLEKRVSTWITRATTSLILAQALIIPLAVYIVGKVFP